MQTSRAHVSAGGGVPAAEVEWGVPTALKSQLRAYLLASISLLQYEPGGTQIRSATTAGERQIRFYNVRSRCVRHYQMCSLDGVQ